MFLWFWFMGQFQWRYQLFMKYIIFFRWNIVLCWTFLIKLIILFHKFVNILLNRWQFAIIIFLPFVYSFLCFQYFTFLLIFFNNPIKFLSFLFNPFHNLPADKLTNSIAIHPIYWLNLLDFLPIKPVLPNFAIISLNLIQRQPCTYIFSIPLIYSSYYMLW